MRGDVAAAVFAVGALALALLSQVPANDRETAAKETSDAYVLPPPEHLVVMSLGHRSAVADLMWAQLLVSQGLRLHERRRFDIAVEYIDGINELDPKWRDPYRMADALVTLQAKAAPLEQVYATRRILERGVKERPTDAELWLILGTFVAFIAPATYLEDNPEQAEQWRRDGAEYLSNASNLAPRDSKIQWHTLGSGKIFAKMGRLDRAVEMYTNILATTEDPELRANVEGLLSVLYAQKKIAGDQLFGTVRHRQAELLTGRSYPGVTGGMAGLLGYPRSAAICAGGSLAVKGEEPECASSWSEWAEKAPSGGGDVAGFR